MKRVKIDQRVSIDMQLDISQALLDAVLTDEWRAQFYQLHTHEDVAQHLIYNLLQGRSLTSLDGFADRDPSEAVLRSEQWEWDT